MITPQEALLRCIEHREIFHDEMLHLFRQIMSGEYLPDHGRGPDDGPAREKGNHRRDHRRRASHARVLDQGADGRHHATSLDIVGTGGDGAHTFNISTASMFVAAAAGARVAKHGGRSVSSSSGSADVIESLGAHIDLKPEQIAQSIAQTGIGFMFAPNHHAAMKNVAAGASRDLACAASSTSSVR
jgi:anthranilate phosphoribosyltransferase